MYSVCPDCTLIVDGDDGAILKVRINDVSMVLYATDFGTERFCLFLCFVDCVCVRACVCSFVC